jgi:hypothetical protein
VGKRIAFTGEGCGLEIVGATNNNMAIGRRQLRYRGHRVIGLWFWEGRVKKYHQPNDMSLGSLLSFSLDLSDIFVLYTADYLPLFWYSLIHRS